MPGLHTFRSFILLLCLMVMVRCDLVENDMCTFDVQEGQVVDMKSSKKQEGLFEMLNATHPETLEECYNSCCEGDVCTVVSFAVEDDSPNCYQFRCDPPESCVFTDNDGFTSVIVRLKGFEDSEGEVDGGVVEEADVFDWSTPEPEASTAVDQTTQKDSTSVMNTEEGNGEISDSNQETIDSVTTVVDNDEPTTQERVETTQAEALTTSQTEAQTTSQTKQMSTVAHTTVQPVITSGAATQQAVTTETGSGGSGSSSEEFEDYTDHNETTGSFGHRMSDQTSTGALVAAMCFGMLFVFAVLVLLGKRFYEGYQRRHYSKMDYLINGMYN